MDYRQHALMMEWASFFPYVFRGLMTDEANSSILFIII